MRVIRTATFFALALALVACGDDSNPTSPTPPTPPTTVTETFTGTVNMNGGVTHTFASTASGTVTLTLTSVTPNSELVMGMSLGSWNGNACQLVIVKDDAKQGSIVVGGVSALGNLCVRIYDVGNIPATEPASYEVQVVHP